MSRIGATKLSRWGCWVLTIQFSFEAFKCKPNYRYMKRVCAMPNEQLPRFGEAAQDGSRGSSKTSSNECERELFERFEHALCEYDACRRPGVGTVVLQSTRELSRALTPINTTYRRLRINRQYIRRLDSPSTPHAMNGLCSREGSYSIGARWTIYVYYCVRIFLISSAWL